MVTRNLGANARRYRRVPIWKQETGWAICTEQSTVAVASVWRDIVAVRQPYENSADGQIAFKHTA